MKKPFLLYLSFLFGISVLSGQQTITATIGHDGQERTYILYVPSSYQSGVEAPLILNFHGYGSTAFQQMNYGDLRSIADTAGFLIVHPLGTIDDMNMTHWNVGWGTSSVDDVGFTGALIDTLSEAYSIDTDRVYSTGMSNGGFFSYRLACELSERIAAIASVTGTMTTGLAASCSAQHAMPVMEIHGTSDGTVPYDGNFGFVAVETVIAHWVEENGCESPTIIQVEDTSPSDGSTVEHRVYGNGESGSSVELFKVIDGGHTWPGSSFLIAPTNQDIDASVEIWRFFSQYDINGLILPTTLHDTGFIRRLRLIMAPDREHLRVGEFDGRMVAYEIYDSSGRLKTNGRLDPIGTSIDLRGWAKGQYLLTTSKGGTSFVK